MGGKAKKTESSSTLPRIRRHLPQPTIKRCAGQYESSDEEDDPNIIAELLAKQASLRAELRVLEDDLEEKNTEIRNLSDDVNRFRFKFNTKLRKVAEALGVGRLVEDL
jgi:predicted RNase H-like nuclease (RuvC/YqgF family)